MDRNLRWAALAVTAILSLTGCSGPAPTGAPSASVFPSVVAATASSATPSPTPSADPICAQAAAKAKQLSDLWAGINEGRDSSGDRAQIRKVKNFESSTWSFGFAMSSCSKGDELSVAAGHVTDATATLLDELELFEFAGEVAYVAVEDAGQEIYDLVGLEHSRFGAPAADNKKYTSSERRFLKGYAKDWDEHASPAESLKAGRQRCTDIEKHAARFSRRVYLVNNDNLSDLVIKTLCTQFAEDLKVSKRALFEGDYTVGSEVRPGAYRTQPKVSNCYWERNTKGGRIIDNDLITYAAAGVTVTIYASDGGFSTSGCGPWIPV